MWSLEWILPVADGAPVFRCTSLCPGVSEGPRGAPGPAWEASSLSTSSVSGGHESSGGRPGSGLGNRLACGAGVGFFAVWIR